MTMQPGRLLGIDHGLARIGLAVCDATRLVARELAVVFRTSKTADFEQILRHAAEQQVVGFVVGLPTNYDAPPGSFTQADKVRNWVGYFRPKTALPIVLWDEQLTSLDAAEMARSRRRKPSDPIDDLAARVMLQSYLDALRDGLAAAPESSEPES